ncbi:type VI secretion system baseplate subunit TssE [Buttiauxella agrestis]|uniref:type VI secretion system baseplate subunit TssE n=1 Tax=Buttiauxella agrestis TaxID=82977 RepID=UPI003974E3CF
MDNKRQFLPTLFERLQDDEPKTKSEPFDKFFFNAQMMRKIVQRDIVAILNNSNIETKINEEKYPWIAKSVLNYGVAPLVGSYADSYNWSRIERNVRNAILRFEPRVIGASLMVRPLPAKNGPSKNGVVFFEIRGLIAWQPYPIDLCFNGAYDMEMEKISTE